MDIKPIIDTKGITELFKRENSEEFDLERNAAGVVVLDLIHAYLDQHKTARFWQAMHILFPGFTAEELFNEESIVTLERLKQRIAFLEGEQDKE